MLTLPFRQIANMERVLTEIPIEDLVLVFSRESNNQLLLVYNNSSLPSHKLPLDGHEFKRLDDLSPEDYEDFDGPILGFSALDVVFPDISTHGVNFYHLYNIYENKKQLSEYQATAYRLAKWLWNERTRFAGHERRGFSKILELALPHLLSKHSLENLVAVTLSSDFTNVLNDDSDSLTRVYVNDLDQSMPIEDSNVYIVALEEILSCPSFHSLDRLYWFDLRLIFEQMGQAIELRKTCVGLAYYYWSQWKKTQNIPYRNLAYYLATEAWLMEKDVEDLIAILPHTNFERFVIYGDAIRVDRIHQINSGLKSDHHRFALSELEESSELKEIIADYQGIPISFQAISPVVSPLKSEPVLDLALVLYRARKETELSRTFLLLSSDLLKFPLLAKTGPSPEQITDMARRATLIYSLSNPWHKLWRARYSHLISLAYSHLVECLRNQETLFHENELSLYYRALREWYGCYLSQDKQHGLAAVENACRDFLVRTERRDDLQDKKGIARQLIEATSRLLRSDSSFHPSESIEFPPSFEVVDYQRKIVQQSEPIGVFSPAFEGLLDAYGELHIKWRNLQHRLSSQPVPADDLDELKNKFTVLKNTAYAPAHELRLIQWSCQRDLAEIESWSQALQLGPILEIQILNHQLIIGKRERLFVEIKNVGTAAAHDFEISLMPSQQFEILSDASPVMLPKLDIGQSLRLEMDMDISATPVSLKFSYRFKTTDGQIHADEISAPSMEAMPARGTSILSSVGNPFQAGTPVYGQRFFGRTDELKDILSVLLSDISQPVLLRGPRRIGKSSIIHHLKYLLTHKGELRSLGFSLAEELSLKQIRPVVASLQEIPSEQFIPGWFSGLFKEICDSIGEECDIEKVRKDFFADPVREFRRYLKQLLDKKSERRLLIMIDEWDKQHYLADLGDGLRNIMQTEERANWIVSSTWVLRAEVSRFPSPFYGHAMTVELRDLVWNAASQLVRSLSHKAGVDWQEVAMVTLLDQTARRPYLIQLLCQQIIRDLSNQKPPSTLVDTDTVGRVVGNFITSPQASGQALGFLWENNPLSIANSGEARLHWLGRLILWEMDRSPVELTSLQIKENLWNAFSVRGLNAPEKSFFDQEFAAQIPELEYIFDMVRVENQHLVFSIPLARNWFHQTLSQYPDPFLHAYTGIMQDYAEWEQRKAIKEKK